LLIGGIEESFNTKEIKDKDQFWQTMGTALKHDAMLGCSITVCIQFSIHFQIYEVFFYSYEFSSQIQVNVKLKCPMVLSKVMPML
jgi:hypothetical protein